jgi:flavin reductase (DIM6/NTAB) family NADH-FMN oxidoreductase RutF
MLSLALGRERFVTGWLSEGAEFTLNILDDSQTDMIAHFGKGFQPEDDAFQGLDIDRTRSVAPVLSEALAYLGCRVTMHCQPGDHTLVIAEVIHGGLLGEGHPLIHVRKSGSHY